MSRETKWTEGPWVARDNGHFWEILPVNRSVEDDGPYRIGDACASCPTNKDSGIQESNAQVMAAAPELYEIAEKMALALERLDSGHRHIAEWVAISAKARGEQ